MNAASQIKNGALLALCLCLVKAVLPASAASSGTVVAWGTTRMVKELFQSA